MEAGRADLCKLWTTICDQKGVPWRGGDKALSAKFSDSDFSPRALRNFERFQTEEGLVKFVFTKALYRGHMEIRVEGEGVK